MRGCEQGVLPMKRTRASQTAMGTAALRALESAKPATERMCDDPYARQFILVEGFDQSVQTLFIWEGVTLYLEKRQSMPLWPGFASMPAEDPPLSLIIRTPRL